MSRPPPTDNIVCRNRKALYRFEILEEIECGLVLRGTEVKSLRDKAVSIEESFGRIINNEVWLFGLHVSSYKFAHARYHDPLRRRKLLLRSGEIRRLKPKVEQKGLTLVPTRIYFNARGVAKVSLALAQGKKLADKREAIKTREHRREIDRAMRRKQ
jgi:SsrA-binding protein